jgi:hypothetical protein
LHRRRCDVWRCRQLVVDRSVVRCEWLQLGDVEHGMNCTILRKRELVRHHADARGS